MKEQLYTYGIQRNLQGIASLPVVVNENKPAIILFNAGVVHKVGPFDINISIANHLSSMGFLVFRFDLSGMGDSLKVKDGTSHQVTVINDLKQTMSFIESQYAVNTFIMMGLCTGADHAHKIACEDARVVGNVWLDGYGYPTAKFNFLRYAPVFFSPRRLVTAVYHKLVQADKLLKNIKGVDAYVWELPAKDKYIHEMNALYKRGVKSLYVFSGGVRDYYNYKDQFADSFKGHQFLKSVEIEYFPEFDHTYIIIKDRDIMIKRVSVWLSENF